LHDIARLAQRRLRRFSFLLFMVLGRQSNALPLLSGRACAIARCPLTTYALVCRTSRPSTAIDFTL